MSQIDYLDYPIFGEHKTSTPNIHGTLYFVCQNLQIEPANDEEHQVPDIAGRIEEFKAEFQDKKIVKRIQGLSRQYRENFSNLEELNRIVADKESLWEDAVECGCGVQEARDALEKSKRTRETILKETRLLASKILDLFKKAQYELAKVKTAMVEEHRAISIHGRGAAEREITELLLEHEPVLQRMMFFANRSNSDSDRELEREWDKHARGFLDLLEYDLTSEIFNRGDHSQLAALCGV